MLKFLIQNECIPLHHLHQKASLAMAQPLLYFVRGPLLYYHSEHQHHLQQGLSRFLAPLNLWCWWLLLEDRLHGWRRGNTERAILSICTRGILMFSCKKSQGITGRYDDATMMRIWSILLLTLKGLLHKHCRFMFGWRGYEMLYLKRCSLHPLDHPGRHKHDMKFRDETRNHQKCFIVFLLIDEISVWVGNELYKNLSQ